MKNFYNPNNMPSIAIAAATLVDGRLVVVYDHGADSPVPHLGTNYRFGAYEQKENGSLVHLNGGLLANNKDVMMTEFEIFCKGVAGCT